MLSFQSALVYEGLQPRRHLGNLYNTQPDSLLKAPWRFKRKDGSTFIGELVQVLEAGCRVPCRDVTERRRAEEQLRRANRDLEPFAYFATHDLQGAVVHQQSSASFWPAATARISTAVRMNCSIMCASGRLGWKEDHFSCRSAIR
jgi:hypothetical protein